MSSKLFINAVNVHSGGGRVLLEAFLEQVDCSAVLLVDRRFHSALSCKENIVVKYYAPTIRQRISAELYLASEVSELDLVFCFGNLPPLFRLKAQTIVFLQNRYLVDSVSLSELSLFKRMHIFCDRLRILLNHSNVDEFIVQTPTMNILINSIIKYRVPIKVLPFIGPNTNGCIPGQINYIDKKISHHFVYVASGEPHKNHLLLLEAWRLLAQENIFPLLSLTLDPMRFSKLCGCIDREVENWSLKINNRGALTHDEVKDLYKNSTAAIFPSKFESFGIPIVEAFNAGLPILASELDYVRDLVDPDQTFDPDSARSIARSVKRHIGLIESRLPVMSAMEFYKNVIQTRCS
jgi:glycosyltransferase involved in cell wall biosynthesis